METTKMRELAKMVRDDLLASNTQGIVQETGIKALYNMVDGSLSLVDKADEALTRIQEEIDGV